MSENNITVALGTHVITKDFGKYPAAHRQFSHAGHCRFVHGHDWGFEVCLASVSDADGAVVNSGLDDNGFVFDFGQFQPIKEWLRQMFDHTCLISEADPQLATFRELNEQGLIRLIVLPSVSCEGLAVLFFRAMVDFTVKQGVADRVQVRSVTVHEDDKNSVTYSESTPTVA